MAKVIAKETDEHRAAYQHYLGQGARRTLAATAAHCGVSQTTVKVWAASFGWAARLKEHEAHIARRTLDLAERQGVETDARAKTRNLKIVQGAMIKLAQALGSGDVKFSLSDLPRLVALEQALAGEPVNDKQAGPPVDTDLEGKSADELWVLLRAEVAAIHRMAERQEDVARLVQAGRLTPFRTLPFTGRCPTCGLLPPGHEEPDAPPPAKTL